jgi:hypothetical protein
VCVGVMLLLSCTLGSRHPTWPASQLVYAFVAADVGWAEAVTVPQQWNRIEEWMAGRKAFACIGEEGDIRGAGGSCGYRAADGEWNCGFTYQCASERTPYCLAVNDIRVRETERGWRVYDWGRICEAEQYGYVCDDMCREMDEGPSE